MPALIDHPIVSPVLVGRAAQLDLLDLLIAEVCASAGRLALIAGEAGIGKSRLAAETRARFLSAAPAGALALRGRCFETDRALPYAPLRELLRPLAPACAGASRAVEPGGYI